MQKKAPRIKKLARQKGIKFTSNFNSGRAWNMQNDHIALLYAKWNAQNAVQQNNYVAYIL